MRFLLVYIFQNLFSDPDPPRNVEMRCEHDLNEDKDTITVTWDGPINARGTILGYNVGISLFI